VLTDPTDHVRVADVITRLLLDGERAAAMGRAGALRARSFAWPEVARRVRTVLEEVAA
jgi:hypothetical protein